MIKSAAWYHYAIIRFFLGYAVSGIYASAYVLAIELVGGTKYRGTIAALYQAGYGIGIPICALLSYQARNWRHLQLAIATTTLPLVIVAYFLPESPRQLLCAGKETEAEETLKMIASRNGHSSQNVSKIRLQSNTSYSEKEQEKAVNKKMSILDLFRNGPEMTLVTLIAMFSFFTTCLCFTGLLLNSTELPVSPFLGASINGFIDILANIVNAYVISSPKIGRKITLLVTEFGSGAVLLASAYFYGQRICNDISDQNVFISLILVFIGKFINSMAYSTVYTYAIDLFPVPIRTTAVGLCTFTAQFGGSLSPVILVMKSYKEWLPSVVFGVGAILTGFIVLLLPETMAEKQFMNFDEATECFRRNFKKVGINFTSEEKPSEKSLIESSA